jgi:hypothetical protein
LARLQRIDQKLVIAVLIGLVSVTGAFMTWKSSQLGAKAVDMDRQAIAETVAQEQSNAQIETKVQDAQRAFVQYKEKLTNAALLDTEADTLDATGLSGEAADARDEAGSLRAEADNLAALSSLSPDLVQTDDKGIPTAFLVDHYRAQLTTFDSQGAAKLNPDHTVAQAVDFRRRSQRLEGWTIALVLAVVLLTIATITRNTRARPWIAGCAVLIFALSASIALIGD